MKLTVVGGQVLGGGDAEIRQVLTQKCKIDSCICGHHCLSLEHPQFPHEINKHNLGFGVKQTWIQNLALPFTHTIILDKWLELLSEHFSQENGVTMLSSRGPGVRIRKEDREVQGQGLIGGSHLGPGDHLPEGPAKGQLLQETRLASIPRAKLPSSLCCHHPPRGSCLVQHFLYSASPLPASPRRTADTIESLKLSNTRLSTCSLFPLVTLRSTRGPAFRASGWLSRKESSRPCKRCTRLRFNPWVGKIPWRRKWQPIPVFLPEKSHGQRSLADYSPWGSEELDVSEHAPTFYRSVLPAGQGSVTSSLGSLRVPTPPASCPHPGLHP